MPLLMQWCMEHRVGHPPHLTYSRDPVCGSPEFITQGCKLGGVGALACKTTKVGNTLSVAKAPSGQAELLRTPSQRTLGTKGSPWNLKSLESMEYCSSYGHICFKRVSCHHWHACMKTVVPSHSCHTWLVVPRSCMWCCDTMGDVLMWGTWARAPSSALVGPPFSWEVGVGQGDTHLVFWRESVHVRSRQQCTLAHVGHLVVGPLKCPW